MKNSTLFLNCLFFILLVSCSGSHKDLYVTVTGDDNNPGTRHKPFRTIQKARTEVRDLSGSGKVKEINIWIGKGTYRLEKTLTFEPGDSGSDDVQVIFRGLPGDTVEFSGGAEISGWEKYRNGVWVARIDSQERVNGIFRELFIDGKRAVRARHPNSGYLRVAEVGKDRRTNFRFNEGDFPLPENPDRVELVLLHDWSITRINLSTIDVTKHVITAIDSIGAKSLDFFNLDHWEKNPRYFLENSMAFLDDENEWYYDQDKGLIYLQLNEKETPGDKKVIVPCLSDNLLRLAGTEKRKVRNIRFENIAFAHCSWSLPESGYAGIQACHFDSRGKDTAWNVIPAAVHATWAENCAFVNCRFSQLGGSGLWLGAGSAGCRVSACIFEDISGNGLMIGEGNDRLVDGGLWWKKVPDQAATGNTVENSTITACGRQFFGAVGIWCGLAARTSILNCHIYDLPYTGISAGWLWNPDPTPCRENRLEGNHIHHVMQILSDGGGIYMLGLQPGSRIVHNHIHDIALNAGSAESNGMFLDEGTTDVEISDNLIYKVAKSPLRFHRATINLVKNNILVCSGDNPPIRYNTTPVENIRLENNRILQENNPEHMKILESSISSWGKE